MTINKKVEKLSAMTTSIREAEEVLRDMKTAKHQLVASIRKDVVDTGSDIHRSDIGTVSIKPRVKVWIEDENKLVKSLKKEPELAKQYLDERPNDLFLSIYKRAGFDLRGIKTEEVESFRFIPKKEQK